MSERAVTHNSRDNPRSTFACEKHDRRDLERQFSSTSPGTLRGYRSDKGKSGEKSRIETRQGRQEEAAAAGVAVQVILKRE